MTNFFQDSIGLLNKAEAFSLETIGVELWNYAVGLKTKGYVSMTTNASLRHVAFLMVSFSNRNNHESDALKKQIIMGMKSGRAWIDACKPECADFILNISNQCIQRLYSLIIERKNEQNGGTDILVKEKIEMEKYMFKLFCCQAEVAQSQLKNTISLNLVHKAKQMLPFFPKEGAFLCMLCYNFGVDSYQRKSYSDAISWLRESFELGKDARECIPKNQARTLRLLANSYLENNCEGDIDQAMNAVTLANSENSHPAGLYLKLRVLLMKNENGMSLSTVLNDIVKHSDCTVDLGLNVLDLLYEHHMSNYSTDFPSLLIKRFEHCPDCGKILVSKLRGLVQTGNTLDAKEFTEECIIGHNNGNPIDASTRKQFHLIFWEQAATAFENKEFSEALTWYNYSLSLFGSSEVNCVNVGKLQRNRASCLINLLRYSQAKEAVDHAKRCDPENVHTQFIIFKIALASNDTETATLSMEKMVTNITSEPDIAKSQTFGLVCLAAQFALEQKCSEPACIALDCLVRANADHAQVLTALRCLVRLRLSQAEAMKYDRKSLEIIVPLIRTAYNKLLVLSQELDRINSDVRIEEETNWFMKIAWNLALKCEDQPSVLKDFFTYCLKLLSLLVCTPSLLSRQKTCTLMAAVGCLQIARNCADPERMESLEEALQCINEYHSLQRTTKMPTEACINSDTTSVLLLLFEFEARVKLRDPGAESVLERALTLPHPESKTFEVLAAIAMESPACEKGLAIRSLKVAIRTHLQTENTDYQQCSKDIHHLIELSTSEDQHQNSQETFNYFKEAINVIDTKAKTLYPEMEVLWLMTKAWNSGIQCYSVNKYDDAEHWCSLSMKLLKHLSTMKANYEDQMTSVYGEILSRVQSTRGKSPLEE